LSRETDFLLQALRKKANLWFPTALIHTNLNKACNMFSLNFPSSCQYTAIIHTDLKCLSVCPSVCFTKRADPVNSKTAVRSTISLCCVQMFCRPCVMSYYRTTMNDVNQKPCERLLWYILTNYSS
jgi:hypothetical protein